MTRYSDSLEALQLWVPEESYQLWVPVRRLPSPGLSRLRPDHLSGRPARAVGLRPKWIQGDEELLDWHFDTTQKIIDMSGWVKTKDPRLNYLWCKPEWFSKQTWSLCRLEMHPGGPPGSTGST